MSPLKTLIAALLLCTNLVLAQSGDVYFWKGISSAWNDPANWQRQSGLTGTLPGPLDHVMVGSDAQSTTMSLTQSVVISSFAATHPDGVSIVSKIPVVIELNSGLYLPEGTSAGSDVAFLVNSSGNAHIEYPASMATHVVDGDNGRPVASASGGYRSCAFFTIVANPTNPTCNGFANGIASVLPPADGVGPFGYQWVGGPANRQWFNVSAGTYTILVFDFGQGGAPCNLDVFVNEPGPLVVFSMNATPPSCPDVCDGTAAPLVIGGNGGYSFNWPDGGTGFNNNQLCSVFTLNVLDQLGCSLDTTYVYTNAPMPWNFDATVTDIFCAGANDGAIALSVTGGTGNLSFSWNGPAGFTASTESISNLQPGTYTIEVTDQNGCSTTEDYVVSEVPPLVANASPVHNICNGGSIGSINLTIGGGNPPYSVSWTGPSGFTSTQQNISGLFAGNYQATITDNEGCELIVNSTVTEPQPIVITINSTDVLCSGGNDGSATASSSGGVGGVSYAWTGPSGFNATGAIISGLVTGTYEVTATDGNGCTSMNSVDISEPLLLELSLVVSPLTCTGGNDGAINLTITGGMGPFTILWNGPSGFSSSSEDISGLAPGAYSVNVVDDNGCSASAAETLSSPSQVNISGVVTNTTCSSGNTGAVDITVTGGTEPYSFSWTGPVGFNSTSQNISSLPAGTYIVQVTDTDGCSSSAPFTVNSPAAIAATFNVTNILCFGGSTGAITTNVSGGTAPYTFLWIGPAGFFSTSQNINDLVAGSYSLLITDFNSCQMFYDVNVNQSSQINITRVITNVTCFGGSNGAITTNISGGTGPYTFAWSGPAGFTATTQNISGIVAGAYTITVTDTNGCTRSITYNVTQPVQITFNSLITDVLCAGANTGAINISIASGAGPFTYSWTGPSGFVASTQNISNLIAGSYTVIATNLAGCTGTGTYVVIQNDQLDIDANTTPVTCFGDSDGSIQVSISGGVAPYTTSWTGPSGFAATGETISGLEPGMYNAQVTDDAGCIYSESFVVSEPAQITISASHSDVTCHGFNDGTASAVPTGGTGLFTYLWSGPGAFTSASPNISGLVPGDYTVEVTDAQGCNAVESVTISESDPLTVVIDVTQPDCIVDNGELLATGSGGTAVTDYTYAWTDGASNPLGNNATLSNLGPGTYNLLITDDNGCTAAESVDLTRLQLSLDATVTDATCFQQPGGAISATADGGVEPYAYSWTGPGGFSGTGEVITGLIAGDYELTVTDNSTCVSVYNFTLNEPAGIFNDAIVMHETCVGSNDGSISVSATGGNPGYIFTWTGPGSYSGNGNLITSLEPGDYNLETSDASGCVVTEVITVNPATPLSVLISGNNVLCHGTPTGTASANAAGGTGVYTYDWTGPGGFTSTQQNIAGIQVGNYQITVTDSNGCSALADIDIDEPSPLEVLLDITDSSCGLASGTAEAAPSGGTGSIAITWFDQFNNQIGTGVLITGLASGVYNVVLEDDNACTASQVFTVSDSDADITLLATPVTCPAGTDGAISSSISGGLAPYIFSWTGPGGFTSNDEQLTDLSGGTYVLTVVDDNGCIYTDMVEVDEPFAINYTSNIAEVSCHGNDGGIEISISGGTAPYAAEWTGPSGFTATGTTLTDLPEGTYNVLITDDLGCTSTSSVDVDLIPALAATFTITDALCGETANGSVTAAITGGTVPYVISWTGPDGFTSDQGSISNLSGGNYDLLVTDALGCAFTDFVSVFQPDSILIAFDPVLPSCNIDNGALTAIVSGGTITTDYFYSWVDVSNTPVGNGVAITNLPAGNYTLTVTDDNGCTVQESYQLNNPGITVDVDVTDVLCNGDSDGEIGLTISTVAISYVVDWTGPNGYTGSGEIISDLSAGVYNYIVTDADGCVSTGQVNVDEPTLLTADVSTTIACFSESNAAIQMSPSGGTAPYLVSWTGPNGFSSTDEDLTDIEPGIYELTVTDDHGCMYSESVEVFENPEIILDVQAIELSCFGSGDGEADVFVAGGTAPYTYLWTGDNGFTSVGFSISFIDAGIYEVEVTDSLGCRAAESVIVNQPSQILPGITSQNPGCAGVGIGGFISLQPEGGVPGYEVEWFGPLGFTSTDLLIDDLDAGIYVYVITDATGCTITDQIELIDAQPLSIDTDVQHATCFGFSDGALIATVNSGTAPFAFAWTGPDGFASDEATITGLAAGLYVLEVTDGNGCLTAIDLEVQEPAEIELSVLDATSPTCNTSFDGSLEVTAQGGTAPYQFNLTGPDGFNSSDAAVSNLQAGEYTVQVIDDAGCSTSLQVDLDYLIEITAIAGDDQAACLNQLPLTITGQAVNGDEFYWTDAQGDTISASADLTIIGLVPGIYEYLLTVSNGLCNATDLIEVEVLPLPVVNAGADMTVFAEEAFTLGGSPTSSTGAFYQWSPNPGGVFDISSPNPTGFLLQTTLFTVSVTDANGCTNTDEVLVTVIPDVNITSGITPNGDGVNDTWIIDNIELFPNNVVSVYNRWGMPIFRAAPYVNGNAWDGTFEGKPLPVGTYYYAIELRDERYPDPFTGPITIFR